MISNSTIISSDYLNDNPVLETNVIGTDVNHPIHNDVPPLKVNLNLTETTVTSIRRPIQTDDSDSDFQRANNKRSQRKIRKSKENYDSQGVSVNITASGVNPAHDYTFDGPDVRTNESQDQVNRLTHQMVISNESTRYALTRYPFPPFVIRFSSGKVTANQVRECLIDHCGKKFQTSIQILNCRTLTAINGNDYYDSLVYVKDVMSFSFLLDQSHWPSSVGSENFVLPSTPTIPPQLCLLIKNVDLNIDFDDFCEDLKVQYPEVKNIIRMKNKFQNDIKMIKIELISSAVRDKLLNDKRIIINYINYDVSEYLAPATVLICSKCMGIGHFRKQCTQVKDTCKTCGDLVNDIKKHNCSNTEKCIHCTQNHKSNSLKCPMIKSFRAELTKKILHLNDQPAHGGKSAHTNTSYVFNSSLFPPPPLPISNSSASLINNSMISKLDVLINTLSEVKSQLTNLEAKHEQFEKFILLKNLNDDNVKADLLVLSNNQDKLKKDVVQQSVLITRHENMFNKLFTPMIEDICLFITSQNVDINGRTLDADIKCKLERYRLQMKKAQEGKHFTN